MTPRANMCNADLLQLEALRHGARSGNPFEVSRRRTNWPMILGLLACAAMWAGLIGWRIGQ